jgi:hypothetical protein
MPEKSTHKRVKSEVAGKTGRKEVRIRGDRRLDVATRHKAVEIERGGNASLVKAAQRLKDSRRGQKVLIVPDRHIVGARKAMVHVGVSGTVRNITGTRRSYVPRTTKSSKRGKK